MTHLSVNVNKVALVRNQRQYGHPDVLRASRAAIDGGAYGITVHPRPDARHVRVEDVLALAATLRAEYGDAIEFNVEGYPSPDFIGLINRVRPTQTTLVPDRPEVVTSDKGWDIMANETLLRPVIEELRGLGGRVALFVEPQPEDVEAAAAVGADRIELYAEHYARAFGGPEERAVLGRYARAAGTANHRGLGVNAGHDLTLANLPTFRRAVSNLLEVSIGHFLIGDALEMGLTAAVGAYVTALRPEAA